MPKEIVNEVISRFADGTVNLDVMAEVESKFHGRLWHICQDIIAATRNFFRMP